ncbi:hypothetical protein F4777DRAFT_92241 [Nemania sp. FL0916]|nr:hypothetical protein F4777DRAFT_92241 [Nemania sp. FL0916]
MAHEILVSGALGLTRRTFTWVRESVLSLNLCLTSIPLLSASPIKGRQVTEYSQLRGQSVIPAAQNSVVQSHSSRVSKYQQRP